MRSALRILSIIPPMTQLNTPYPSTAYLTGFLRSRGFHAEQIDLSIALASQLLSVEGLLRHSRAGRARCLANNARQPTRFFAEHFRVLPHHHCRRPSDFLQGRDPSLAHRIASRHYLPEGPRFASLEHYVDSAATRRRRAGLGLWCAGTAGSRQAHCNAVSERPRATSSATPSIRASSSSATQNRWRRANRRSISCTTALSAPHNLVDASLHALTLQGAVTTSTDTWCSSRAPFPGNVYGAFRIAQTIKQTRRIRRHGTGWRLLQYRAAHHERAACFRLLRFRHARRRRTPAACTHRTPAEQAAARSAGAHLYARASGTSTSKNPISHSPKAARPPTPGCRWTIICRCSTCSTRCTASGRTAAGTSSRSRTAAIGRNAASAM